MKTESKAKGLAAFLPWYCYACFVIVLASYAGMWLPRCNHAHAAIWFAGSMTAAWLGVFALMTVEMWEKRLDEQPVAPERAKELFRAVREAIPVDDDELNRAKPVREKCVSGVVVPFAILPEPNMRVVCGWCHTILQVGDSSEVSHGICPECLAKHFPGCQGAWDSKEAGI